MLKNKITTMSLLLNTLIALPGYATDYILVSPNPNSSLSVPDNPGVSFLSIQTTLADAHNFIYSPYINGSLNWADLSNISDDVIVY